MARSDNVWLEAQLLPMNDQAESDAKVKSIAVTEFHFIVLRDEYLEVYCRLNGQQVQSERISMTCGTPIGLFKDCSRNLIWLYTDIEIFQVTVQF